MVSTYVKDIGAVGLRERDRVVKDEILDEQESIRPDPRHPSHPITIILTWFYNRSGGNILSTAMFHAGKSTFPSVLPYAPLVLGPDFRTDGMRRRHGQSVAAAGGSRRIVTV
jgi:hypothetical protein